MVASDDDGTIDVIGRVEFNGRVVVQELVEIGGPDGSAGDQFAFVEALPAVGDDAARNQQHNAFGEKLGMHPQVILVLHGDQGGLRSGAQSQLQSGAVIDEL